MKVQKKKYGSAKRNRNGFINNRQLKNLEKNYKKLQ